MSESIKVSVIIPIYNMELYLSECLDSVFGQSLKEMEVICIDDGSTDKTKEILEEYNRKYLNMRIIHQNRQGAGNARNKGIEIAQGEFIAFMDSDDYYPSNDVLETLYNAAIKNNVPMAGGSIYRILESKTIIRQYDNGSYNGSDKVMTAEEYQFAYAFSGFIYDRNMIVKNNICFPDFVRYQDPPFMLDALIAADKLWITSKDVYAYREFDKKIEFTSRNVACDIVRGYLHIMQKSKIHNYCKLQSFLLDVIQSQNLIFMFHVCNGNNELHELINETGDEIIEKDKRESFLNYWKMDNIKEVYRKELIELDKIDRKIEKHKKVIIYGAGRYGKAVYDYIASMNGIEFIGFAVTESNPEGTARGHIVRCLSHYTSYKDDALLIIAVKGENNISMRENAEKLGFRNLLIIDYRIENLKNNKITEGKFAFDNGT